MTTRHPTQNARVGAWVKRHLLSAPRPSWRARGREKGSDGPRVRGRCQRLPVNALASAGSVVVAQAMELGGLADLEEAIAAVRAGLGHDVAVTAILACRVRTGTILARDVIEHLRKQHAQLVLDVVIRENVRVAEADAWQEPVITDDSSSAGAADYRAAGAELQKRITP